MFRIRLLSAVTGALVAGLAVATIATARGDAGGLGKRDIVFGAGTFGPGCAETHAGPFCITAQFTFRLLARSRGHGGRASGVFERRNDVNGNTFLTEVTCANVEGNRAAIGGIVTRTPSPDPSSGTGVPFILYVEDNGTLDRSDGTTPDRISPFAVLPEGDPDLSLMPEGFPRVCPSPESIYGYFPLTSGDITVSDGK